MKWCCKKRKKKIGFGFVTLLAVVHHIYSLNTDSRDFVFMTSNRQT